MSQHEGQEFGKYRLLHRMAMGGMAEIYRAELLGAAGFSRDVVIKRIHPEFSEDQEFVRMFINEAKLAALLRHPNIVQVIDFDQVDGNYYIAMELVEGADLRRLITRGEKVGVHLPLQLALHIAIQVLKGLYYAHQFQKDNELLHIVHRDVSPHNILISMQGEVKVTDFGIARIMQHAGMTASGVLKGKTSYMSPEQTFTSHVDHRADVFAVGIVLWEMLCQRRLFAAVNDLISVGKVRDEVITPPHVHNPAIPEALSMIVMSALERPLETRVSDARTWMRQLQSYLWIPSAQEELSLYLRCVLNDEPPPPELQYLNEFRAPILTPNTPSFDALASGRMTIPPDLAAVLVARDDSASQSQGERPPTTDLGAWRPPARGAAASASSSPALPLAPVPPSAALASRATPGPTRATDGTEVAKENHSLAAYAATLGVDSLREGWQEGTVSGRLRPQELDEKISSRVEVSSPKGDWLVKTEAFSSASSNPALQKALLAIEESPAMPSPSDVGAVSTVQVNPSSFLQGLGEEDPLAKTQLDEQLNSMGFVLPASFLAQAKAASAQSSPSIPAPESQALPTVEAPPDIPILETIPLNPSEYLGDMSQFRPSSVQASEASQESGGAFSSSDGAARTVQVQSPMMAAYGLEGKDATEAATGGTSRLWLWLVIGVVLVGTVLGLYWLFRK